MDSFLLSMRLSSSVLFSKSGISPLKIISARRTVVKPPCRITRVSSQTLRRRRRCCCLLSTGTLLYAALVLKKCLARLLRPDQFCDGEGVLIGRRRRRRASISAAAAEARRRGRLLPWFYDPAAFFNVFFGISFPKCGDVWVLCDLQRSSSSLCGRLEHYPRNTSAAVRSASLARARISGLRGTGTLPRIGVFLD